MAACLRRSIFVSVAIGLALVLASSRTALATPVNGTFDIGGASLLIVPLGVSFDCNPAIANAPCPAPPPQTGNFITTGGTGSFAPYTLQGGYVRSLSTPVQPINEPFSLPDFLVFSSAPGNPVSPPDVALDLGFVFAGVDPQASCGAAPAPGQTCTPALPGLVTPANPLGLAPFNLQNTQSGSTLSFSVAGTARRISTGETTPFDGVFTAQFAVPYQSVLAQLATTGAATTSYSASFRVVPEPGTVSLLSGGLAILAGVMRRRG